MSTLLEDVKKGLGDWFSKAADKAGEFSRDAADKAEEVTKLGKVKLDSFQIKRDIEKLFSNLGGTVYHLITEEKAKNIEGDSKVQSILKEVKELEKNLKLKEKEYESIKKSHFGKPTPEKEKSSKVEKKQPSKKSKSKKKSNKD